MKTRLSRLIGVMLCLGATLLAACASPQQQEGVVMVGPTTVRATRTPQPSPTPTPVGVTQVPTPLPLPQRPAISAANAAAVARLLTISGHSARVFSVAFHPEGRWLASGAHDGEVRLWEAATGLPVITLGANADRVNSVAFNSDGSRLAAGYQDGVVRVWPVPADGAFISVPEAVLAFDDRDSVIAVAISPRGAGLAAVGGTVFNEGRSGAVMGVWSLLADEAVPVAGLLAPGSDPLPDGHGDRLLCATFSPDAPLLATGSYDRTIRLWSLEDGGLAAVLEGHEDWVTALAFRPSASGEAHGDLLAAADHAGAIRLWEARAWGPLAAAAGSSPIWGLAFNPAGSLLAAAQRDGGIALWNVRAVLDGTANGPLAVLDGHDGAARSVSFSPDGSLLASAGDDHTILVWGLRE